MKKLLVFSILMFPALLHALEPRPEEIRTFFDSEIPLMLEEKHIAGMTVSVVHQGKTVFKKGYGFADLETKTPVNPDKTGFRPGSISKLFTWTAVMQLHEQGRLELDTDINQYLDFNIPDTFSEPITISHLMSHRPGFEDRMINLFVKDTDRLLTLEEAVKNDVLKRVRRQGEQISYSNYGTMLAGYIVQRISGMPFEEYVEKNIFKPLGMNRSTFRQPLTGEIAADMSRGYAWDGSSINEQDYELINGTPAGSMTSTADDMAKFLIAHLSGDGGGILQAQTMKRMHSRLYSPDANINGMAHGFMELGLYPVRVIGHGGDTIYFHSLWFVIPENNLGVFYSLNTGISNGISELHTIILFKKFMKAFFPAGQTGRQLAIEHQDLEEYSGAFTTNRRSETDMTKIMGMFMTTSVAAEDGGLKILNLLTGKRDLYLPVGKDLFQKADGFSRAFFRRNNEGKIVSLFLGEMPVMEFVRQPIWENNLINIVVLLLSILLVFTGFIFRPFGLWMLFSGSGSGMQKNAVLFAFTVTALHLVFLVYILYFFSKDFIFAGWPPVWPFLIPWVAFIAGLPLLYFVSQAWRQSWWMLPGRIFYTLFGCMMQLFFLFLWYWNLAY
ncbi:MAG: beta-lactamase family protein [Spirochaetia bacterium]|nr:beta-lactamase family protein [Spirochaetia bacterium]